ncbi:MAG: hydrogenase [Nitrospirae bacterium]|nr:hydrogenase [Nitrospirota bacterium]
MAETLLLVTLLSGLFIIAAGGVACLLVRGSDTARRLGAGVVATGSILGMVPAIAVLAGAHPVSAAIEWAMPFGRLSIELDPLSAFFLLAILGLSALSAIYGVEYTRGEAPHGKTGAREFFFAGLVLSMAVVVLARNALFFLIAWEAMALTSFFLVTSEHQEDSVRKAGWIYLVASQAGAAFVLVLFLLMGQQAGSYDFDRWSDVGGRWAHPTAIFVMALVGFGTKAGFVPLHVWLPEAHPAAPSHVSALMSGVMIKTGIYGLLRMLLLMGTPSPTWGWALIAIGATSGVLGVLFALAQHDLKRLLAYHSIENIGIITLGIGLGVLGLATGRPTLAVAGFAGGILHVLNHAVFKGLLFLGAGAVAKATGTRDIDHLGGLAKTMPWTALTFLVGSIAISGLPPLNGFVSELFIYVGAFRGALDSMPWPAASAAVIVSLALIGGLACACFTKAFGIVFLGSPRSTHAERAHEVGPWMRVPMFILAGLCVAIGLAAPYALQWVVPVVGQFIPAMDGGLPGLEELSTIARSLSIGVAVLVGMAGVVAVVRNRLLRGRSVKQTVTWDCGYARPAARMQYTASSFAQPLTDLFGRVLRTRKHAINVDGYFPRSARYATETPDAASEEFFAPAFRAAELLFARFKSFQHGRLQLYVLYLAATLFVLLILKLG